MINLNLNTITASTDNSLTIDLDNFYSLVSDFNDQTFITKADIGEINDMIAIQKAIIESESYESIMPIVNVHNKLHTTLGISDNALTGRSAAGIRDYYVDSIGSWIVDKLKWLLDKLIEFFKWCWTKFKSLLRHQFLKVKTHLIKLQNISIPHRTSCILNPSNVTV
jgi:hypothetical protein